MPDRCFAVSAGSPDPRERQKPELLLQNLHLEQFSPPAQQFGFSKGRQGSINSDDLNCLETLIH